MKKEEIQELIDQEEELCQLHLDSQLCFPLYAASRIVVNHYTPFLKPYGITYTQYVVLLALWEKETATVGELCERLYLDNGTMTPLLKKMEKTGLIKRRRSKEDERVVTVHVTNEGWKLREEIKDVPFLLGKTIPLNKEDAFNLYRLLNKLLDGFTANQQ